MEGVGNDFVVVPAELLAGTDPSKAAVRLCERRFGIGADGLLTVGVTDRSDAVFSFHMYNPDGTPDMCGNGLRCAVLFAHQVGLLIPVTGKFGIETVDGILEAEIVDLGQRAATVRVEMRVPRFAPTEIPFADVEESTVIDYPLNVGDAPISLTAVNTGSTHAVVFSDELPTEMMFQTLSPLIENHPYFPNRTSIMWTAKTGPSEFTVRIWERAASETLGCGTGACAVAAAAVVKGLANFGDTVDVISKGGALKVTWSAKDAPIQLTGPAKWVYEGQTDIGA
jgi:diaminopimelate epimerase